VENLFESSTDCNLIKGKYTLNKNKIKFDGDMTLKGCGEAQQDTEYFEMLSNVISYEIKEVDDYKVIGTKAENTGKKKLLKLNLANNQDYMLFEEVK